MSTLLRRFSRTCLTLWLVVGRAGLAAGQVGTIVGTVRDSARAEPVRDALVVIVGTRKEAVSDRAGAFLIERVGSGTHTLEAYKLGYVSERATAVLRTGFDTVRVEFRLRKLPAGSIIPVDPRPKLTACGTGRSLAAEWIATMDSSRHGDMGLEYGGELRSLENPQLCPLLLASAMGYILDERLTEAWYDDDPSSLDWSLVITLMLRVGMTAVLDFAVYEPSMYRTADPDRPEPLGRRLFVTNNLASLRVIAADVYSP